MSSALTLMVAACASGPPQPPPPPPFTPAGVFDVSFAAMGQQMSGTLTIEAMDGGYSGSFATDFGTLPLTDFTVDGTAVTFSGTFSQFALAFTLAFAGEGFTGDVSMGDMGSGAITGVTR